MTLAVQAGLILDAAAPIAGRLSHTSSLALAFTRTASEVDHGD
jgi:hypothetical protein